MKNLVKTKEASKILGVHHQTLYRWGDQGKIEVIRTPGNDRLFNVEKFLKENHNITRRKVCYCKGDSEVELMQKKFPRYEILFDNGTSFKSKEFLILIDYAVKGELEELVIYSKDSLSNFEIIELLIHEYSSGKISFYLEIKS